jgi:hypothetical protein
METALSIVLGILVLTCIFIVIFEYRVRQPDVIVLYESKGKISVRRGLIYPRHFSLPLKRTTCPVQLTIEASAMGNLGVRIRLVGSAALSAANIQSLIRVGGWNVDAVARAAEQVGILLQGMVKEYTEQKEIHTLSSLGVLKYLTDHYPQIEEKFGVELISLAVQSLEPTDPGIAEALRQQEQARILEQTEKLNNQARLVASKARFQADQEIAELEHSLDLKKAELQKTLQQQDAALAQLRVEDELARNRLRLAFEKEQLEVLKSSPELLMLTPQAARLAEASQNLKNARTVISLTPQDFASSSELLALFNSLIQKALEDRQGS